MSRSGYIGRRKRVDANQREIADALQRAGASVCSLADTGDGCPDLLVGVRGVNLLLEVKNPKARPNVEEKQREWAVHWTGQYAIVTSIDDALDYLKRQR